MRKLLRRGAWHRQTIYHFGEFGGRAASLAGRPSRQLGACLCDVGPEVCATSVDAIVIGAGIVGASAALQLARAQRSVLVVDREVVGSGATGMSCATMACYGDGNQTSATAVMCAGTLEMLQELQAAGYECGLRHCGVLEIARSEAELEWARSTVEDFQCRGYDAALLSAEEAVALEPALKGTPGLVGAIHLPRSAVADPCLAPAAICAAARDAGAEFWLWENCSVLAAQRRLPKSGGRRWRITVACARPTTADATGGPVEYVDCDDVVLAAGAWASEVGHMFGIEIPVAKVKAQMWAAEPTEKTAAQLSHILYGVSSHMYWSERPTCEYQSGVPNMVTHSATGERYCHHLYGRPSPAGGGEVWFGGDRLPLGYGSPQGSDFVVDEAASAENFSQIAKTFPALALQQAQYGPWSGVVGASMHGAPLVGELPYLPGLWLCTGFGGSGFMKGPGAATAVAAWISAPSAASGRFAALRLENDPAPWVSPLAAAASADRGNGFAPLRC